MLHFFPKKDRPRANVVSLSTGDPLPRGNTYWESVWGPEKKWEHDIPVWSLLPGIPFLHECEQLEKRTQNRSLVCLCFIANQELLWEKKKKLNVEFLTLNWGKFRCYILFSNNLQRAICSCLGVFFLGCIKRDAW